MEHVMEKYIEEEKKKAQKTITKAIQVEKENIKKMTTKYFRRYKTIWDFSSFSRSISFEEAS